MSRKQSKRRKRPPDRSCAFVLEALCYMPSNDPRNTLEFHIACIAIGTNKLPDIMYRTAQRKPSMVN
eukprot:5593-Eustigmatos_ZCMA.PRE.1